MDDRYKFLDIESIQFEKDKDFKKNDDRDFIGSIQRGAIVEIKALRCANKCTDNDGQELGTFLIEDESPMTGYCGHHFCHDCAKKLYGAPSSRMTPKRINRGLFEVDCAVPIGNFLYNCKSCREDIKYDKQELGSHILRVFSKNIMLGNLYAALKGHSGFHCEECKRKEKPSFHPKYNSLYCTTCFSSADEVAYFCVWHVAAHLAEKKGHHLITTKYRDEEEPAEGEYLCSLDRRDRKVFAPLYHCACCSTSLEKDVYKSERHRHLECGHFIGARCVKKARKMVDKRMNKGLYYLKQRKDRDKQRLEGVQGDDGTVYEGTAAQLEKGVFCIFCKKDSVEKSDLNVYPVFPPMKKILKKGVVFSYDLLVCKDNCKECDYTTCNTQFAYKRDDEWRNRCKWCQVEHKLQQQLTNCKETNNL